MSNDHLTAHTETQGQDREPVLVEKVRVGETVYYPEGHSTQERERDLVSASSPNRLNAAPREQDSLLSVIYRAATDPTCDLDRMERLFAMHDRLDIAQREREFDAAMSTAQGEMRAVSVDSTNLQTRSKYASYFALDKVVRPIYAAHGFALSFSTKDDGIPDIVRVTCRVSHTGGFSREHDISMPADGKGAKGGDVMTKTHALGSATTYGMRYLLKMIFNLPVRDGTDDDGNGASGDKLITTAQAGELRELFEKHPELSLEKFLIFIGQSSLDEIQAKDFTKARRVIDDTIKARMK